MLRFALIAPMIGRVAESDLLFPAQKGMRLRDIVRVGRRSNWRMGETGLGIDTDRGLHPEAPFIALLRLMHFQIVFAGLVLGRGWSSENRRIHDRTLLEHQSLQNQVRINAPQRCARFVRVVRASAGT